MRKIPVTVLLETATIEELEKKGDKEHASISATARNLIEKGLVGGA